MPITLYAYFRSSASWRVRIALALKGLQVEYHPVHLRRGDQFGADGGAAQQVPTLVLADGTRLTQSLAILDYLDEAHPQPPLLPADPLARAFARSLAHDLALDVHPLQNLRVLRHLQRELGQSEAQSQAWARHWIERGLRVVESRLQAWPGFDGRFCLGAQPGYADCVLIPQLFNAQRFGTALEGFPAIQAVAAAAAAHPAFIATHPSRAPDAES